jgi:hypothetical protein
MSKLRYEDVAKILTAAGGRPDPKGKGIHLLYVDPTKGSLTSKLWAGDHFDNNSRELIAAPNSVSTNSPACFLITPTKMSALYISPSFKLCSSTYSEEEEEWNEDGPVMQSNVLPSSKLAVLPGIDRRACVFFQDPSARLICLDDKWTPTTLNVDIMKGSPLLATIIDDKGYLFYISKDSHIYSIHEQQYGRWSEPMKFSDFTFESEPKRILVYNTGGALEAFALTEKDELWRIKAESQERLGKVDPTGDFKPGTAEQSGFFIIIRWGRGCCC